MILNQAVSLIVLVVWAVGCIITRWSINSTKGGTSGGMGLFIFTWLGVFTFTLAALIGWGLSIAFGAAGYIIALLLFIIFVIWFVKR